MVLEFSYINLLQLLTFCCWQMKDNSTTSANSSQLIKKNSNPNMEISKQAKLNQLSVQKIRNLVTESILKKSTSLSSLGPFMFNPPLNKIGGSQECINQDKDKSRTYQKFQRQSKSPKKMSMSQSKEDKQRQSFDIQQKRTRIYGMPYFFQQKSIQQEDEEDNYIALPPPPQYLHPSIYPQSKIYTQTISTTSSHKLKTQLKMSDFEIGKILGIGKFGQVFMARHIKSGFVCALKQIKKDGLDQILKSQLVREIKIQMFLNHPNIVKLYTFFADSTSIYLVLQLCSSGQLYNFLRKNQPIKQDLAKVIIRQICQGLDYIHENHIIHRDLKPQNILYHNSMMKICDFGWSIATPLMRETFCGTPLYVSPQLLKRKYYNNKIDSWSLGILAYEILIGQVPFEIFCEADYIKILKNDVKFPKYITISEEAKDFIRQCLQKDPDKRLTSGQLLQHPFLKKVELINFPQIY